MEEKKNNNAARAVVSYILAFVLCLVMVIATAVVIVRFVFMESGSLQSLLGEEYYTAVLGDIITSSEDYTIPTNISLDVLEGVFTYDEVKADVIGQLDSAFEGTERVPDTAAFEERLRANLAVFFETEDVETDGEIDAICNEYVSDIVSIYSRKVEMPGVQIIVEARANYGLIMLLGLAVLIVIIAGLVIFILKLYKPVYEGLRFIAYSTGAAALMSFTAPAVLFFSGTYKRLNVSPEYFYRFVVSFIRRMLDSCFVAAGVWLAVTALIIGAAALCASRAKKRGITANNVQEES